jgi:uncharacterized repeat protein (TIGR02543 family)
MRRASLPLPQSCLFPVIATETAKLTAQPKPGFVFKGWSGACSGNKLVCNLPMSKARNVTATFVPATLKVTDVKVLEGDSGKRKAVFKVLLPGATGSAISVTAFTADGSAKAPADYTRRAPAGLTIGAGKSFATVVVPVVGERRREGDESFLLKLKSPQGATIADGSGKATIRNDD